MYISSEQLSLIGFRSLGENIRISDKASFYNPSNISIADNARIDDFCILSAGKGGIFIGKYVHVAAYCCLIGNESIILNDLSGISSRVTIYSSTDDFHGDAMAHPTIPEEYRKVVSKPVVLHKHALVGSGSTILPGVTLHEGATIGAMSLVTKDCDSFSINAGIPSKKIKNRKRNLLDIEKKFVADTHFLPSTQ